MAKRIRRIIGAIFIITAIILTQIPPRMAQAASVAKEYFLLDEDTLTEYTGTATTVSVADDIKVIGEEAFANNPYLGVINIGKMSKRSDTVLLPTVLILAEWSFPTMLNL